MSQRSGEWLWSKNLVARCLYPLSLVYCGIARFRSHLYQSTIYKSSKPKCTVIVVGNLSVGGSGKTPVVKYLVTQLQQRGLAVGVITRGYKSQAEATITLLNKGEQNALVGDESNMLSEVCHCPIGVGIDRPAVAQRLYEQYAVDVIISDDGLQHYALARDIEIVIKRKMAMGNGWCLPAGPLREPLRRLERADIVIDRDSDDVDEWLQDAWHLSNPTETKPLKAFTARVHAIAGIGFPQAFFEGLRQQGLSVIEHHFADHYDYSALDVNFNDGLPILMTHKDAVKIRSFKLENCWVVPLQLKVSAPIEQKINNLINAVKK